MFRKKRLVRKPGYRRLDIKVCGDLAFSRLIDIWPMYSASFSFYGIRIIDGPRIYFPKDKYAAEPLNKGFSSFIDYINRQTTDVKIYVPREYFDYV